MKQINLLAIAILLTLQLVAQGNALKTIGRITTNQPNSISDFHANSITEELLKIDKQCAHAANTSDMERLWDCWTDDAIMLMSTEFQVEGKDAIKAFTTQAREDPNFQINWIPVSAKVSPHGDMGYTYGNGAITRTGKNGQVISMTEPYLSVWKKDNKGQWKMMIEN